MIRKRQYLPTGRLKNIWPFLAQGFYLSDDALLAQEYDHYCKCHKIPFISVEGKGRHRVLRVRLSRGMVLTKVGREMLREVVMKHTRSAPKRVNGKGLHAHVPARAALQAVGDLVDVLRSETAISRSRSAAKLARSSQESQLAPPARKLNSSARAPLEPAPLSHATRTASAA
jgi:hypothetical protein